jgi:hypothetical protein
VGQPHQSHGAARAHGTDGLGPGRLGAHALEDPVGADPLGEIADRGDALLAALGDDVGGTEDAGDPRPVLVAAHRDDGAGAELDGGQDRREAYGPVAHHGDGVPRPHACAHRRVPAGAHDVGEGQQARDEALIGHSGSGHESAVGPGDPDPLGLGAVVVRTVQAVGLGALAAHRAGVVGRVEASDDEVSGPHTHHVGADLLDDTAELMADRRGLGHRADPAVPPQVRTAHAGGHRAHHDVVGFEDHRIGTLLVADVPGGMNDGSEHDPSTRRRRHGVNRRVEPAGNPGPPGSVAMR